MENHNRGYTVVEVTPQPTGLARKETPSEKVQKIFGIKYRLLSDEVPIPLVEGKKFAGLAEACEYAAELHRRTGVGGLSVQCEERQKQVWIDYLRDLGVKYIWSGPAHWSDPVDRLIEHLSSSPWDGYVIRDPSHLGQFICVPRDLGDKILVLGALPSIAPISLPTNS